MELIEFPKAIYKGNNINSTFTINIKNGKYTYNSGDKIILGIKSYIGASEYILKKEINTVSGEDSITIEIDSNETKNLPVQKAVLELTLINEDAKLNKTVYQDEIELKGVVNNE